MLEHPHTAVQVGEKINTGAQSSSQDDTPGVRQQLIAGLSNLWHRDSESPWHRTAHHVLVAEIWMSHNMTGTFGGITAAQRIAFQVEHDLCMIIVAPEHPPHMQMRLSRTGQLSRCLL